MGNNNDSKEQSIKNITWKLWYGEYLLEEIRGSKYVASIQEMREYVNSLKENWAEFADKRNSFFYIIEYKK
jgi:predicted Zn-dependent protease